MQNTFSQSGNDSKWLFKKSFFRIRMWNSRPPLLHEKIHLKFPFWLFDYLPNRKDWIVAKDLLKKHENSDGSGVEDFKNIFYPTCKIDSSVSKWISVSYWYQWQLKLHSVQTLLAMMRTLISDVSKTCPKQQNSQ